MALRKIDCILLKNSNIVNRPLPSTLLGGEAIVNTADGIVFFSGVTSSTNEWTPAGVGAAANFWEVGSNLYDLRLRNRITEYEGISGAGLVGMFLSGTSAGFVLAPISSIAGVDTYVTAFTYNNNVATIYQNFGQAPLSILIDTMTGLTVNGVLSASTANVGTGNFTTLNASAGTITTLGSTTINANQINATASTITTLNSTNIITNNITATTLNASAATITTLNTSNINTTNLTATTISATTYLNLPTDVRITGGTFNNSTDIITFTNNTGGTFTVTGLTDNFTTGATLIGSIAYFDRNDSLSAYTLDLSSLDTNDTFVTGGTFTNNDLTLTRNDNVNIVINVNSFTGLTVNGNLSATGVSTLPNIISTGITTNNLTATTISATTYLGLPLDVYVTGGTYNGGTATYTNNSGGTFQVTGFTTTDTYVTGFTYTPASNQLTISQNQGQPDLNVFITSFSGLSIANLTPGRVVIVGAGGVLTDDAGFTYNATTNVLSTPADGTLNVGTGGLYVTGDAVIQGSLTVFGAAISAFTSQLYVEDPNVIFNYNPTGCTIATSVCAGLTIQDGNGVCGGDVAFDIRPMNAFSGSTACPNVDVSEYTGSTGYDNRAWVTQLHDIVLRSTNGSCTAPDGVRVLTECDCLDAGTY